MTTVSSAPLEHDSRPQVDVPLDPAAMMEFGRNGTALQHNATAATSPLLESGDSISQPLLNTNQLSPSEEQDGLGSITGERDVSMKMENGPSATGPHVSQATSQPTIGVPEDSAIAETSISVDTNMPESQSLVQESDVKPSVDDASRATESNFPTPSQDLQVSDQDKTEISPLASVQTPMLNDQAGLDTTMTEAPPVQSVKMSRGREDDVDDEPRSKRLRTDDGGSEPESQQAPAPVAATPTIEANPEVSQQISSTPTLSTPQAISAPSAPAPSPSHQVVEKNWGPTMTEAQNRQLKQNIQNLKKGRHAVFFSKPVDFVALNIPSYPQVIKNPMDLGTLEQKLKDGKYASVRDFVADFNLIVNNSHTFNGRQHAVSIAADNLKAQFDGGMRKVPEAGQPVAARPPKKRAGSFALPSRDTKPRTGRQSLGNPTTAASPGETFALSNTGIPTVRRTSTTDGRPKREIKPVQPRDMPYSAKPKKKKYQMELKFCQHVLTELYKGRYAALMTPFAKPVDPVAFNIPNYHKMIKKPMDFGTVAKNLQAGEYENAKEFEADVRLIFENCIKFNGPAHPIAGLAKQFDDIFSAEMAHKATWINHNAPPSAPQSPEVDSDSNAEEDVAADEEEDEAVTQAEELRRIQQQIAELSAHAMALTSGPIQRPIKAAQKKGIKSSKIAPVKPSKKSSGSAVATKRHSTASAVKQKTKAVRPLTNAQKEEIAVRIGELDANEVARAAEHIKAGLRRVGRHDLADRPDDELEFDIAVIPEDALQAIYKMIKAKDAPSDYRSSTTAAAGKTGPPPPRAKKNKPMSKHEQEAAIRRLENQAKAFDGGNRAEESSPANDEDDDDESSGSESEEE